MAAGIVAAQAIGEPGTQLTMRTFHSGGVAGLDITQGLPRVEELFEARDPKVSAVLAEIDGRIRLGKATGRDILVRIEGDDVTKDEYRLEGATSQLGDGEHIDEGHPVLVDTSGNTVRAKNAGIVRFEDDAKGRKLMIVHETENYREYVVPSGLTLTVREGDLVTKGQALTEGHLNLNQLLSLKGRQATQDYVLSSIQDIYSSQGQTIGDKHVEIIVRQMFSKIKVTESGSTDLMVGDVIEKIRFDAVNEEAIKNGGLPAQSEQLLMGITKVSLATESWLAAASFQETTRVLIEAATTAKTDFLKGLKENVIIGKTIPAGTGFYDHQIMPAIADITLLDSVMVPEPGDVAPIAMAE
jgi:DNA-directed RNA polymerase subunit beta'